MTEPWKIALFSCTIGTTAGLLLGGASSLIKDAMIRAAAFRGLRRECASLIFYIEQRVDPYALTEQVLATDRLYARFCDFQPYTVRQSEQKWKCLVALASLLALMRELRSALDNQVLEAKPDEACQERIRRSNQGLVQNISAGAESLARAIGRPKVSPKRKASALSQGGPPTVSS